MVYRREDVRQLGLSCSYDDVEHEPLVLTIDAFVEQLDLGPLHARYREAGMGYYDPGMMLKAWFLAYCDRSYHCRQLAAPASGGLRCSLSLLCRASSPRLSYAEPLSERPFGSDGGLFCGAGAAL